MMCFRISGNAASSKNIHGTVSAQLKKNFAKSRWKVRTINRMLSLNFFTNNLSYCITYLHTNIMKKKKHPKVTHISSRPYENNNNDHWDRGFFIYWFFSYIIYIIQPNRCIDSRYSRVLLTVAKRANRRVRPDSYRSELEKKKKKNRWWWWWWWWCFQQVVNAISILYTMQRLTMNGLDPSSKTVAPPAAPAAVQQRQKCATIVEESEVDDDDDDDDDDRSLDDNYCGAVGRMTMMKKKNK